MLWQMEWCIAIGIEIKEIKVIKFASPYTYIVFNSIEFIFGYCFLLPITFFVEWKCLDLTG
jgi:hypothetical protein